MFKSLLPLSLVLFSFLIADNSAFGASGTWNTTTDGLLWSDSNNWLNNVVADGTDNTADFNSVDIPGAVTVHLDTARTIGNVIFGDLDGSTTPASWTLDNNGTPANVLTFQTTSGTPGITVNATAATISAIIAGTNGLAKSGTGALTLGGSNTYSGGTIINAGSVTISNGATLGSGGLTFTGTSGASSLVLNSSQAITGLTSGNNTTSNIITLTGAGTILTVNENSNTTFGGTISGAGSFVKNGPAVLTLTGTNNYTGTTTLARGTLKIDMATVYGDTSSSTGFTSNIIRNGSSLIVSGGTFQTVGGSRSSGSSTPPYIQNVVLTVNAGHTAFIQNRGSSARVVNGFGTVTRAVGGTLVFVDPSNGPNTGGFRLAIAANINGVVPYIAYTGTAVGTGNTGWFTSADTSNSGTINAGTNSTASSLGTSTQNSNVVTDVAVAAGGATINTIRFNDSTSNRTVTIGASDTLTVSAGGILVTNNVGSNHSTITGGTLIGGSPGSGSGNDLIIIQLNNPSNGANADFTIGSIITDGTAATALTKSGIGTLILTNTGNTYTGKTFLNGGITNIAAGTSLGVIPGSPVSDQLTFNGGTLQLASSFDLNSNRGITLNANGGTFDTQANSSTYAGVITGTGAFTKAGSGTLTLTGSNNYSGGTTVSAGVLKVNAASAAGTGLVTVSGGATLGGTGNITNAVSLSSGVSAGTGGHVAPGNSVGTLTVGSITFASNSVYDLEFNSSPANDLLNVTNSGGLTINGGGFNLYTEGTTNKWLTTGTYNIVQFNGSIGGTGLGAWTSASILNPQSGLTYAFGTSGGFITLAIGGSASVTGTWNSDSNFTWGTASNWTGNNMPGAAGDAAEFLGVISAPRTVTLDGNRTVGIIEFSNTNSYTIASGTGGSLIINNTGFAAQINDLNGSHTISAPVTLSGSSNTVSVTNAVDTLTISGQVSGSTAAVTKSGSGTLVLSASNSYGGGTTLNSGAVQFTNNSALSTGTITSQGNGTLQAGADGLALANNIVINSGVAATVDSQANTLTLNGAISGSGTLAKIGSGVVILNGSNTYGATTLTSGTVQVGTGGTSGSLGTGTVANAGALVFNRSDTYTQSTAISGTGTLTQAGSGKLILGAANTMSGGTLISSGTLELGNSAALQNSSLDTGSGSLSFGLLTSATLGGLTGSQNIGLVNTSGSAVALTVNPLQSGTFTYSGILSGSGSFTKVPGVVNSKLILAGSNTYTGTTTVGTSANSILSTLEVGPGASLGSGAVTVNVHQTLRINGGTVVAPSLTLAANSGGAQVVIENGSTVTFNTTSWTGANSVQTNPTDLQKLTINGGTVSLGAFTADRDGNGNTASLPGIGSAGLIINSGTVTASSVTLATNNSWCTLTVAGGSLTIGSGTSNNAFLVGKGSGNTRGGLVYVTGGALNYSGSDGMILNAASSSSEWGIAKFSGGISTLNGVTLNAATVTSGSAGLEVSGSAVVYLGSVGIVSNTNGSSLSSVTLLGGTLGAAADWSTSAPMSFPQFGTTTFQAADASNVSHDITLNGNVSGIGVATLIKTGGGTLTMNGSNTYGATTVNTGRLVVNGSLTGGGVQVNTGAILGGTGTVEAITLATGAKLAPGNSIGTLNGTSLTWNSDNTGSLLFELSNSDNTSDLLNLSGDFSKGTGTAFVFDFQNSGFYNGSTPTTYTLVNFTTNNTPFSVGDFAYTNLGSGLSGTFSLNATTLQFAVVPEPGTWAMLLGGSGMLLVFRRARNRNR